MRVSIEGDPEPYKDLIRQLESRSMQLEEDKEFVEAHIDVDNFCSTMSHRFMLTTETGPTTISNTGKPEWQMEVGIV